MNIFLVYWHDGIEDTVIAAFSNEKDATTYQEFCQKNAERGEYYWVNPIKLNDKCTFIKEYTEK